MGSIQIAPFAILGPIRIYDMNEGQKRGAKAVDGFPWLKRAERPIVRNWYTIEVKRGDHFPGAHFTGLMLPS